MNYQANLETENAIFFEQPYLKKEHFDLEGDSLFEENYDFSSFHKIFPEPSQKNYDNEEEKSLENESTISNNEIKEVEKQKIEKTKKIRNERQHHKQKTHHTLKKSKKQDIKKTPDYKKNICGYITKKIIKELLNQNFRKPVTFVLSRFGVTFEQFTQILKNYNQITGPTHLYDLVNSTLESQQAKDIVQQILVKRAFRELFIWFLRNRYIRFIMNEGKMERKDVYIRYKNRELLHLINQESEYAQVKIDQFIEIINQSNPNRLLHGEQAKNFGQKVYTQLVEGNEIQMKQKLKESSNKLKHRKNKIIETQSSHNNQSSIFQLEYTFQSKQTFEFTKIEF